MIESSVIIVGGGPAGSSCARELKRAGIHVIILDKQEFPRDKLCAGWITPRVVRDVQLDPARYPGSLTRFNALNFRFYGRKLPVRSRQYAIRRSEFDHWLLQRAGAPVFPHTATNIRKEQDSFIIDDKFRCTYLVGAGGTSCPVYRTFFKEINPRIRTRQITTLELEMPFEAQDRNCYLWFFDHGLPGYSWYLPKRGGWLNIGIGGKASDLLARGETIRQHWRLYVQKLNKLGLVSEEIELHPRGHTYFLRHNRNKIQQENAFIIGDAAGLATLDMGEGIGPAVRSGILAAGAIIRRKSARFFSLPQTSLPHIFFGN